MKRLAHTILFILLILVLNGSAAPVEAACNWTFNATGATATTCGIDSASYEMYDYDAGGDSATNGYTLTIPAGVTVTVNAGTNASTLTYLGVGAINFTGGSLVVSGNHVRVGTGPKCYVADADSDGYSPTPNTCVTSAQAGYRRKSTLTAATVDCGDGNANARPGQTSYFAGTFTNGVNGSLTHDWNCNGVETQAFTRQVTCSACTNGSGYASVAGGGTGAVNQDPANTGWAAAPPACNVAGTRYTRNSDVCRDPAAADCYAVWTNNGSVTQTCL